MSFSNRLHLTHLVHQKKNKGSLISATQTAHTAVDGGMSFLLSVAAHSVFKKHTE